MMGSMQLCMRACVFSFCLSLRTAFDVCCVIFVASLRSFELKITMEIEMLMVFCALSSLWIFKWESPTLQFVTKCVRHIDIWINANCFRIVQLHTKRNDKKRRERLQMHTQIALNTIHFNAFRMVLLIIVSKEMEWCTQGHSNTNIHRHVIILQTFAICTP